MNIKIIDTGYCKSLENIAIEGGSIKPIKFPAMVAILEHPEHGIILFDTGYSRRIFDATKHLPERLYRFILPPTVGSSVKEQLDIMNINCRDVAYIIVSHFHSDHTCGLKDFPNATFVCSSKAYDHLESLDTRGKAAKEAVFKQLIPDNIDNRLWLYDLDKGISIQKDKNLGSLHDLFGDGSILINALEGHMDGQIGIIVNREKDTYFLVADACWLSESYKKNKMPSTVAQLLFADVDAYRLTLKRIHQYHQANPTVHIIPTHCNQTVQHYVRKTQSQRFKKHPFLSK